MRFAFEALAVLLTFHDDGEIFLDLVKREPSAKIVELLTADENDALTERTAEVLQTNVFPKLLTVLLCVLPLKACLSDLFFNQPFFCGFWGVNERMKIIFSFFFLFFICSVTLRDSHVTHHPFFSDVVCEHEPVHAAYPFPPRSDNPANSERE